MNSHSRSFILVAFLAVMPLAGTAAQQSNAAGSSGGNQPAAAKNLNTPGATGKTVVPGNKSTVAGDKNSTVDAKTGQTNTGGSGGGR